MFQSTLPHGERRPSPTQADDRSSGFNPRSRMGSDVVTARRSRWCPPGFNPRSRMGSDNVDPGLGHRSAFQSTLPHGERPTPPAARQANRRVSIHAPAWGATDAESRCQTVRVSIHAPAWGATYGRAQISVAYMSVSIHAPAWGATVTMAWPCPAESFNPRSRMGSDGRTGRYTGG